MFKANSPDRLYFHHSPRRSAHGQTLIIVLAVMFVLLLIGGIFVAQIARNLTNTGASRDAQTARDLAEAGIRYCDEQLTRSVEGADWRPTPTRPFTTAIDTEGITDPDYYWLGDLGGFARLPLTGGRALVRVSYEPNPSDPRSNLIKIEAVGRVGELGTDSDPTVFVQRGSAPKLRRELIAYKQIGLTDYGRFITNLHRTFAEAELGMGPTGLPLATVLGDPTLGLAVGADGYNKGKDSFVVGYPIRANTSLSFMGDVFLYHSARGNSRSILSNEGIQTSGNLTVEPNRVLLNQDITSAAIGINNIVHGSKEKDATGNDLFSAFSGRVRDGSNLPDASGIGRNIPRLEPPTIDTLASGTGVMRYRQLTRDSGAFRTFTDAGGNTVRYNTGSIGWGRGVYVDNREDLQKETTRTDTLGGYSLRADWVNPDAGFANGYWHKPYYRPPGVEIELMGDHIRLTRSDNNQFRLPNNQTSTVQGGKVIDIPLSDEGRSGYLLPDGTAFPLQTLDHDGDNGGVNSPYKDKKSYGVNLVIMAEGNVRVKGAYGNVTTIGPTTTVKVGRVHLTIVTGGTAYIEGNIVKGDGYADAGDGNLERASTCAILAHDYVCVNTTMFMSPQNDTNAQSQSSELDAFHVNLEAGRPYDFTFSYGTVPGKYLTNETPSELFLMLRHKSDGLGSSFINLLINPGLAPTGAITGNYLPTVYPFNADVAGAVLPPETYEVGGTNFGGIDVSWQHLEGGGWENRAFSLSALFAPTFVSAPSGIDNLLRFQTDQTLATRLSALGIARTPPRQDNYSLGGVAVVPLDIRIEAMLYAQERSFFVIPGYGFNPEPKDTRANWLKTGTRASYIPGESAQSRLSKDVIPFYGEPIDVRITMSGTITENYTASIGDQTKWMQRWGFITDTYGSSGIPVPDIHVNGVDDNKSDKPEASYSPGTETGIAFRTSTEKAEGIARGMRYLYDPTFAFPYYNSVSQIITSSRDRAKNSLRYIERIVETPSKKITYRQLLPPVPKLPVCPGLLYFGEPERRINQSVTPL